MYTTCSECGAIEEFEHRSNCKWSSTGVVQPIAVRTRCDNDWTHSDYEFEHQAELYRLKTRAPGQSKRHSWYETFTGTFTGFLGSFAITYYVMKYAPFDIATKTLITTLSCTVWSIVRGYYNRRFWNWKHTK